MTYSMNAAKAAGAALMLSAAPAMAEPFSIGLWGDMPYAKAGDGPFIPALIADMNAADLAFSIYNGDIKDGSSECADSVFDDAKTMFNSLSAPVVYVPGDNEWTDCHRKNNGGYNNLERLSYLRKVMFAAPVSFGQQSMSFDQQGAAGEKFSENTRFSHGGVMFVGLNIPGSNNNKVNSKKSCEKKSVRSEADCAADNAEYQERDAANIAWLADSFSQAKAAGAKGVMVTIQANPGFDTPGDKVTGKRAKKELDGYTAFLDALIAQTRAFKGEVVLVHGDSHYFEIDKPLPSRPKMLANFTRVQTFGSPNVHWVRADVDVESRNVFTFIPMIVPENANKTME